MEAFEASPEGCGSLGTDCNQRAALEFSSNRLASAPRRGTLAALDVQRADQRAQPTYHRPGANFRFCDESRGEPRVDDEDVEPRDVIEDQHAATGEPFRRVLFANGHGQDGEERARPTAFPRLPLRLGKFRVEQPRDGEAARQMKREPCQSEKAQRNRSAVGRHRSCDPPSRPGGILTGSRRRADAGAQISDPKFLRNRRLISSRLVECFWPTPEAILIAPINASSL